MDFDWLFFGETLAEALRCLPVTLGLAALSLVVGLVLGLGLAVTRIFEIPVLRRLTQGYVVVIKGVPMVVMLFLCYYGLSPVWSLFAQAAALPEDLRRVDPFWVAAVSLMLTGTAFLSETWRGALTAVGKGQYEASYSVGLSRRQAFVRIVLPQAVPVALPQLCNNLIGLVKGSSIAFLVSVVDVLNGPQILATGNYRFLEAYIAAALVYWAVNILVEQLSRFWEKRFRRSQKEVYR